MFHRYFRGRPSKQPIHWRRRISKLYPDIKLSLRDADAGADEGAEDRQDGMEVAFARPLDPPFDHGLRVALLYRHPVVVVLPRVRRETRGASLIPPRGRRPRHGSLRALAISGRPASPS